MRYTVLPETLQKINKYFSSKTLYGQIHKQQQPNILATKIDRKIYCIVEKSNMAVIISNMAAPIF